MNTSAPGLENDFLIIGLIAAIGVLYSAYKLVEALRHGFSIRHQVYFSLVGTTFVLTLALTAALAIRTMAVWDRTNWSQALDTVLWLAPEVAFLVLVLTGAAALSAIFLGRLVAQPVERLTQASLRVAAGERQATLPLPRGREVRELTQAFESMRRELEQRHIVEQLAADLSHELKNPVASIRASAEVLEQAIGEDEEAARRFAHRILEASARLDTLTHDLLDLARLEATGLADPEAPVDLVAVIHGAAAAQRSLAKTAEVELLVELPAEARTAGDAIWLSRAVENLLANAIAFSPAGSTVRVTLDEGKEGWELAVRDTGAGVESSIREQVFERFVGSRHGEGGTGLGLAIVRAVAEAHGGGAQLRESSGDGSCFALCLPRG